MASLLALVKRYLAEGFGRPHPIPRGEKGPRIAGWNDPTVVFNLDQFADDANVGTLLTDLVDVDLDQPEARAVAPSLLPLTDRVHGRSSARRSHYWYRAEGLKPEKFKDVDGNVLVEIRAGSDHQTVLPPSVHPSGEIVEWDSDRDPAPVAGDGLRDAVRYVAIAALLARHWPKGSRHDAAGAAAGLLAARGLPPMAISEIIGAAASAARDEEVADRVRYARETAEKFVDGSHKIAGGPKLESLITRDVVQRINEWFDVDGKRAAIGRVERTNEQYAVLGVGNRMVVAEFDAGQLVELWPFDEFKKRLGKEPNVGKQSFADYWLKHPKGRQHNRLVYVMPGSRERLREGDYNGWQGYTVTPAPGDWSRNRDHLFRVICRGDRVIFDWVINWLRALFQQPGRHAWSSIVLRGEQGTGKGHFADFMIGKCFHPQQYLHLVGANQLTAEFNEHFSGKVFIFGDETCWGGEKQAAEKLKGLITEDTILIHRKFLKAVEEPSALHIVMASNSEWPVAIPRDDRRFLVLDIGIDRQQDQEYFAGLRAEFAAGGRAAMLHDLLQQPVDDAALRQPPDTAAKAEVKERTFTVEETFVQNWLMNIDGTWTNRISKRDLYDAYVRGLPRNVSTRPIASFGRIFKSLGITWIEGKIEQANHLDNTTGRVNAYVFPPLAACRKAFDAALRAQTDWPSDDCPGEPEAGQEPGQGSLEMAPE